LILTIFAIVIAVYFESKWFFHGATIKDFMMVTPLAAVAFLPAMIVGAAVVLPLFVWVAVLRLHDIGYKGWWILLLATMVYVLGTLSKFVPYANSVTHILTYSALAYLFFKKGDEGENRFGLPPGTKVDEMAVVAEHIAEKVAS